MGHNITANVGGFDPPYGGSIPSAPALLRKAYWHGKITGNGLPNQSVSLAEYDEITKWLRENNAPYGITMVTDSDEWVQGIEIFNTIFYPNVLELRQNLRFWG
jgi:hypothetical protein